VSSQPIQLMRRPSRSAERERLVRRAKLLAWLGVGWHGVEAAVAVGAGLAAGSIALIGFGADSLIESAAGIILLWRFAASHAASEDAEQHAQKLIAGVAVKEGRESWRGESCCTAPVVGLDDGCDDDCCAPGPPVG
jgi:hypothetical protein